MPLTLDVKSYLVVLMRSLHKSKHTTVTRETYPHISGFKLSCHHPNAYYANVSIVPMAHVRTHARVSSTSDGMYPPSTSDGMYPVPMARVLHARAALTTSTCTVRPDRSSRPNSHHGRRRTPRRRAPRRAADKLTRDASPGCWTGRHRDRDRTGRHHDHCRPTGPQQREPWCR